MAEEPRMLEHIFPTAYHFRDIGVQTSPLILGNPRQFAIFRLPLQLRLIGYRLRIWQIDRSNGGIASE